MICQSCNIENDEWIEIEYNSGAKFNTCLKCLAVEMNFLLTCKWGMGAVKTMTIENEKCCESKKSCESAEPTTSCDGFFTSHDETGKETSDRVASLASRGLATDDLTAEERKAVYASALAQAVK